MHADTFFIKLEKRGSKTTTVHILDELQVDRTKYEGSELYEDLK